MPDTKVCSTCKSSWIQCRSCSTKRVGLWKAADRIRYNKLRKTACSTLKKHHEKLKDDPDHLSCDFLKKIIGVDCK